MKIEYTLLVLLIVASVISCRVAADSEEEVAGLQNRQVLVDRSNDRGKETADLTKNKAVKLDSNDPKEQIELKEKEKEQKKGDGGDKRDALKMKNEGSSLELNRESKEGRLPPVREECDSTSNHCTDDDKTLVACLRVPGNDSPSLSLLIQNRGKGFQSITISAPDSVQLERKKIGLQENKDAEVKVSLGDVENGHFIVLTAGHGNCTLNLKDEFMSRKANNHNPSSSNLSIYSPTLSRGVVFLGGLVIVGISIFMCSKSGRNHFRRKDRIYQRLDMELPVSHGTNADDSWDNSWGDTWDDEEAPVTSLPLTPTLRFKEGWKD
ncbi:hypothetical protein SASPL_127396 [Salvia splendens]|uniref:DUF7356 domain-containing protein n=1 Tax=Salvia splendens TaxID=180675 RepID=A0A8X8XAJ6_SALSN|nr:uncharacterized protein LOC121753360 [Salvia splendens]XP_042004578.1 uncharacterized protein LOC121753360 [Salvia splendens]XP_042004579.1 uncharacterized protein LOC121753360 [Salvia splendens]KAG6409357.1 hypothetical protein SASPL_127396 [Salvia splendens]